MHTLSFGMRAALASVLVHGTIVAVVATQRAVPRPADAREELVDVQRETAEILPPPPAPAPPAAPARPTEVAPTLSPLARHDPSPAPRAALAAAPDLPGADEPPVVIEAPATAGPTFTMTTPVVSTGGAGGGGSGAAASGDGKVEAEILDLSGEYALADRIGGSAPDYPPEAQAAHVEGDVPLEILVDTAGHVIDVRVERRAGHGFDEAALSAVRRWLFKPRLHDGHPVSVRLQWTMQFRLE